MLSVILIKIVVDGQKVNKILQLSMKYQVGSCLIKIVRDDK